jgi:MoaD family protein
MGQLSFGSFKMKVKVRALFQVKELLGTSELIVNLNDGSTIEDLLRLLESRYGENFRNMVYNPLEGVKPTIMILVNGRQIQFIGGIKTRLAEGDTVSLIPPAGGG